MCDWISVKEKMPEEIGDYLTYIQKPLFNLFYRDVLTFGGECGFLDQGKYVTHWQPLPEPPKDHQ